MICVNLNKKEKHYAHLHTKSASKCPVSIEQCHGKVTRFVLQQALPQHYVF